MLVKSDDEDDVSDEVDDLSEADDYDEGDDHADQDQDEDEDEDELTSGSLASTKYLLNEVFPSLSFAELSAMIPKWDMKSWSDPEARVRGRLRMCFETLQQLNQPASVHTLIEALQQKHAQVSAARNSDWTDNKLREMLTSLSNIGLIRKYRLSNGELGYGLSPTSSKQNAGDQ